MALGGLLVLPLVAATLAPAGAGIDVPALRARGWLAAARDALDAGQPGEARVALTLAWMYVGTPLFAAAWRAGGDEATALRAELRDERDGLLRRAEAVRLAPELRARLDHARAAVDAAHASRRPDPERWQEAADAAAECVAVVPPEAAVDLAWPVPPGNVALGELAAECAAIGRSAAAGHEAATAAAAERAAAMTGLLRGDRASIYARFGEPDCECGGYTPAEVARAKVWTYVRGPTGALRTWETLTFTFRGDKLVAQKQRISHDRP